MQKQATRKTQIGYSKILTAGEIGALLAYLYSKVPSSVTGERLAIDSVRGRRLLLICQILLNTGLRIGELARLRVRDTPVIIGENVIEIYKGKYNRDRSIPISGQLTEAISWYVNHIRQGTLPHWIISNDDKRTLFYSDQRRPYLQKVWMTAQCTNCKGEGCRKCKRKGTVAVRRERASTTLYRMICGIGRHAGLKKKLHPHIFRHTFAVLALGQDDIYQVMQWMGHSDMKITARYLHLVDRDVKAQGERLNFSFEGKFL